MRSAFLVDKQRFELRDVPDPAIPDDGVVLRVEACGVCGSDLRRWKEGPPGGLEIVPGHEIGGTIVQVGKNVDRWKIGTRLAVGPDISCGTCYYCRRGLPNLCDRLCFLGITPGYPGGFAEKITLTGDILSRGIVHEIPESLSTKHAALAEPCSSVLAAQHAAGTSIEDIVVVLGAGPIGCIHIAVAKARGASVFVSEPNAIRRDLARTFKPDVVVDPVGEDLRQIVSDKTDGRGADIVICANPVAETQSLAVEIVRKAGEIYLFGGLPKENPYTRLDGNRIHYGEIRVIGSFSYHPRMHELALELLACGTIPAELLITRTQPLEEIACAFESAARGDVLKVMVEI